MPRKKNTLRARHLPGSLLLLLIPLLFILTSCVGLFGNTSWQKGVLQDQHLQVLTADPHNLRHIYAGDARDGVFASPDTGISWKKANQGLPLPLAVNSLSFDTPDKKLFAATSAGLFTSSNSAHSWQAVPQLPHDTYTALAFDANSPQVVYVASAHSGAFVSTNDGGSWTSIGHGLPAGPLTSILYDSTLKQLWVASANMVYRSDDQGASWHSMSNGLPANVGINVLALGSVSSGSLIFAGTNHGFYRSTNSGQHWAQSQMALSGLHIQDILPDATQSNVVYISTNIGVLTSTDNGQNWNQVAPGLSSAQSIAGLTQGGDKYSQLFVAARGVYLYPGTQSAFDPSRIFPIILILLFFIALYYFLIVRRRRRSIRRLTEHPRDASEEENPPGQDSQNGHV
jgi:photosystem II stability/assembly factor-like uncharacterized protein